MPKTVCLDFDGVMNTYSGWKGENELFSPRGGLKVFLERLIEGGFDLVVHSTRPAEKIRAWLETHGLPALQVMDRKPPAVVYLDDRAVCFTGSFEDALHAILNFRVFWEAK